jgi:cysteine synthase
VTHPIQGLAVGLVPAVLDMALVDDEISVTYSDALEAVRSLMRAEGIAVGISSAANLVVARRVAAGTKAGACILTFAYDGVMDYLDSLPASFGAASEAVEFERAGG